ncbi:leucine-rich repeat-containing protein 15-like [Argonauta hians]
MYKLTRQLTLLVCCAASALVLVSAYECPDGCQCSGDNIHCPVSPELFQMRGCSGKVLERSVFDNVADVRQLCLTGNRIRNVGSQMFRTLWNLRKLDLTNNQISSVNHQAFQSLKELQGLVLFNNNIASMQGLFKRNTELTFLNLASNRITEIREDDFKNLGKLRYLDLSTNLISSIHPKAFKPLVSLRYLLIQSNKIADFFVHGTPLQSLHVADLTNNMLNRIPKGLPGTITDLRIGKNNITRLGKSDLKHMVALQLLTLNENQITSIHSNAFNGLDNVKELWLDSNRLDTMPTTLPRNLLKLAINSNLIRRIEGHTFEKSPLIKDLTLETNQITDIKPEAFSKLQMLQHLNLQSNKLRTLTAGTFKDMLNLASIRLANNPIASIERGAFESLPALRTLDISYGELEKARVHMDIFKEMPRLHEFNLMNSPGLCKSLLDLVEADKIETVESVREMDFRYNILKNLPENTPDVFPQLTTLLINNNAWHCDSELIWLKKWLMTSNIAFHSNKTAACCTPPALKGRPLIQVKDSELRASPPAREDIGAGQYEEFTPNTNPLTERRRPQAVRAAAPPSEKSGTSVVDLDRSERRRRRRNRNRGDHRGNRQHARE